MKKRGIIWLLNAALLIGGTACDRLPWNRCQKGKGERTVFKQEVTGLKEITIDVPLKLTLAQDTTLSTTLLEFYCEGNVYENLEVSTASGKLSISFKECITDYEDIELRVESADFDVLEISGPANVSSVQLLRVDTFSLLLESTSTIDLSLRSTLATVDLDGAGNITLNGYTDGFVLNHNSVGSLSGFNFPADSVVVNMNSVGAAEVSATEKLIVGFDGNGQVSYRGNPVIETADTTRLINANL